ncbi:MAG: HPF/RaiA family ribosome-associated protein [Patescibacteria group bacterium]|nr:HPF/RaiA family ribosome-associated protein [Patescibacteria group bacterium]
MTVRNLTLEHETREYVEDKLSSVQKYLGALDDSSSLMHIMIRKQDTKSVSDKYFLEVLLTVAHHPSVFAEVSDIRPESAADALHDKLMQQIEKLKRSHNRKPAELPSDYLEVDESAHEGEPITKRKRFSKLRPITEETAIENMEMIGHEFYLFLNSETNRFSVVYKRKDDDSNDSYGLIEPLYDLKDIQA